MFDDNYDLGTGSYYDDEPQGPKFDIQKYKPFIIIGVLLIIAFIAYSAWVGMHGDLTINVNCKGETSCNASISLINSNGDQIANETGNELEIHLPKGEYNLKILKTGYNKIEKTIVLEESKQDETVIIYKDYDFKIENDLIPGTQIYGTQKLRGILTITNKGTNTIESELEFNSDDLEMTVVDNKINLPNGSMFITYTINMIQPNEDEDSEDVEYEIGIKGARQTETYKLTSMPSPELEISGKLEDKLSANTKETKTIEIENKGDFIAKDLTLTVTADLTSKDKLNWFSFTSPKNGNPYETQISEIGIENNNDVIQKTLDIDIPITAQEGDKFTGKLVLSSPTMDGNISVAMNFTVNESAGSKIVFKASSNGIIKTNRTEEEPYEKLEQTKLSLENEELTDSEGVTIQNIAYYIDELDSKNDPSNGITGCSDIVSLMEAGTEDKVIIPQIEAGDEVDIPIRINILPGAPSGITVNCVLGWYYTDPVTKGLQKDQGLFYIELD